MPATSTTPAPLEGQRLSRRDCEIHSITAVAADARSVGGLIGQIKLTRIHVLSLYLPGVRVKRDKEASLYDVERSANRSLEGRDQQTCSLDLTRCVPVGNRQSPAQPNHKEMVEPDGIEPTTSCLQSRRSPS